MPDKGNFQTADTVVSPAAVHTRTANRLEAVTADVSFCVNIPKIACKNSDAIRIDKRMHFPVQGRGMFVALCIGYILGALPFGFWIAKVHGVCIFDVGSGNPGATNVLRTIGKKAGYTVFFLDALKGMVATFIGLKLQYPYVGLVGALVGHGFSFFIRFKGGKGVATLIGGLFLLMPLPLLSGLLVWLAVFKYTRYVSCASICFVFSLLPFCCLWNGIPATRMHALPLFVLCVWILVHHRKNLVRLWRGEENRF